MLTDSSFLRATGAVALRVIRPMPPRMAPSPSDSWALFLERLRQGLPYGQPGLGRTVNTWRVKNLPHLARGLRTVALAKALGIPTLYGALWLRILQRNGDEYDLGLASLRVVTNNGVGFIVDAFQNLVTLNNMHFHGLGTGSNPEAATDTALQTELTTQYNPNNTRGTGTTTETSSNVYSTVATSFVDAGVTITEHGIFSVVTAGSGVLLDRSVFAGKVLVSGDGVQSSYGLTLSSGG